MILTRAYTTCFPSDTVFAILFSIHENRDQNAFSGKFAVSLGPELRDVTRRLNSLVHLLDHYPLLLFHVGTNDAATKSPRSIKRNFRALGRRPKNSGAQVVFSSILPVMRRDWKKQMSPR